MQHQRTSCLAGVVGPLFAWSLDRVKGKRGAPPDPLCPVHPTPADIGAGSGEHPTAQEKHAINFPPWAQGKPSTPASPWPWHHTSGPHARARHAPAGRAGGQVTGGYPPAPGQQLHPPWTEPPTGGHPWGDE
ncbi:unnamed protein product [Discosporangium mesarthrocarpum]